MFIVRYAIQEPDKHNSTGLKVGPFQDRALAEQTLANLANNPDFRGGWVEESDED